MACALARLACTSLRKGASALSVAHRGGALLASWKRFQVLPSLIAHVIPAMLCAGFGPTHVPWAGTCGVACAGAHRQHTAEPHQHVQRSTSRCISLPGKCWADIQQLALIGSGSSLHSEACNALGASDGVIHSSISQEVPSLRAAANNLWKRLTVWA